VRIRRVCVGVFVDDSVVGRKPKPSVAVIQSIVVRTSRIVAASGLVGVGHVPVRWSLIG
jgi:hypothetical protein